MTTSGRRVSLDATGSFDPDGQIVDYAWSLGDGRTANGQTVEAEYPADGEYPIILTVKDDRGAQASLMRRVTVAGPPEPPEENRPPQAVLVASPASGPATLFVTFDSSGSSDPDGFGLLHQIDFGDGTPPGAGIRVTHAYRRPGTFTARLTVTDDQGATGTTTATITVGAVVPNQRPTAKFTLNGA